MKSVFPCCSAKSAISWLPEIPYAEPNDGSSGARAWDSTTAAHAARSRPDNAPTLASQSAGPIYHSLGVVYGFTHAVTLLAAEPTSRQRELQAFAEYLRGEPQGSSLVGNKQFWRSDYMAHRRRGYFTSIKTLSRRTLNAELINSKGRKSVHLSDGVNFIYISGNEYHDIFPAWAGPGYPGPRRFKDTGEPDPIYLRPQTIFAGGVSDGIYGVASMDLKRGKLTADKSWFFFDASYVAMGTDITLAGTRGML